MVTSMHKNTLRLLLPSLLFAATLVACGDKAADAPAAGSATRAKSFNVPATVKNVDADEEEVKRFRLTMDGVRKYHAINLAMGKLDLEGSSQATDTDTGEDSADAESESDDDHDGESNSPSHDQLETYIDSNKQARALIAAHGMDTRDYVVMTGVLMAVGFAQMSIDQGANPESVAKEMNISAENLQFYKEHRKEFDAMQKTSQSK